MEFNKTTAKPFSIEWGGTEWVVNQQKLSDNLPDEFLQDNSIEIITVLDAFYKTYYDNSYNYHPVDKIKEIIPLLIEDKVEQEEVKKIIQETLPWEFHKAIYELSRNVNDGDYKKYIKLILTILNQNWILGWHWRATLPVLFKWSNLKKDDKLIIQISHFRKWEILLCYAIKNNIIKKYKNFSNIPLKDKKLLRAPILCESNRLKGWDAYRLFFANRLLLKTKNISENDLICRKLNAIESKSNGKKRQFEIATIIGRHDCYYIIESVNIKENKFYWEVSSHLDFEPEKVLINESIFGKDEKFYYSQPDDLISIPSFGNKNNGIPQLLSSDNYCEAVINLTEILNDPTVKSVLLIAPPGSGKEELSKLAYYCKDSMNFTDSFIATSLAGLNSVEASKLLFSFEHHDSNLSCYKANEKDGLLLKALGGALFIDEIDKTDESIKNMLLRTLESGEFTVPGSSMVVKIPKEKIPLYIFSGSKSKAEMFKLNPSDFWTRISHVVEIEHPLNISDIKTKKLVLKDYVWMFWCRHVNDFMKLKDIKKDYPDILVKPLNDYNKELYIFLLDKEIVTHISDLIVNELMKRGHKNLYSIRTLRSIVGSAVYKFIDLLMYAKSEDEEIEKCKYKLLTVLKNASFETWFNHLKGILSSDSSTCPNENGFKKKVAEVITGAVSLVDN